MSTYNNVEANSQWLDNLIIEGGYANGAILATVDRGSGGGILNRGGHLRLTEVTVRDCYANCGGGIASVSAVAFGGDPFLPSLWVRGSTIRDCVAAGMDLILHATLMDETALEAVAGSRTPIMPVFTFQANLADFGATVGADPMVMEMFRREIADSAGMLRRAYDAGVPLLCGSESGFSITPYGHWHAREMEVFVQHMGLTPLQAISCATYTNAHALQQFGQVGVIAPNTQADILVVDGHPEKNVSILGDKSTFRHLFKKGVEVTLQPVPERIGLKGERVEPWSAVPLTRDLALGK
jgi:hypothetical protein